MKQLALTLALITLSATAGAVDVGQHPAVFSPRSLPGIDPSTFIVGHPAGGHGKPEHTASIPPLTAAAGVDATAPVALTEGLARPMAHRSAGSSFRHATAL